MSEPSTARCPQCGGVASDNSKASLTQWLMSCRCGLPKISEIEPVDEGLCKICGRRKALRSGSFTQWVLGGNTCKCDTAGTGIGSGAPRAVANVVQEESAFEPAIHVEESKFPCDRYVPLAILGRGSFGTVYRARDRELGRMVAVKVLRTTGPTELIAFQNEAKATSALRHPNLVDIYDFGVTTGGAPYMVMEFVNGESLSKAIEDNGRLPALSAVSLFIRVCDGTLHAHKHGVFHRDIKPSNILVSGLDSANPEVRIVDFGIAKMHASQYETAGQTLTVDGTPHYMAPELVQHGSFDARSEAYSIGCSFFETLSGNVPFQADSALAIWNLHAKAPVPIFEARISDDEQLVNDLNLILSRCLAKDPKDRFTVEDLCEALHVVLNTARSREATRTGGDGMGMYMVPESSLSESRFKWIAAAVFLIICVPTIFYFSTSLNRKPKHKPPPPIVDSKTTDFFDPTSLNKLSEECRLDPVNFGGYVGVKTMGILTDAKIQMLADRDDILGLQCKNDRLTAAGLKTVVHRPWRFITFHKTSLDGPALDLLGQMKTLEHIELNDSGVGDKAVSDFGTFPNLRWLQVKRCPVTDKGLIGLSRSRSLEDLDLGGVQGITDEGICIVMKCPLRELDIGFTNCTDRLMDCIAKSKTLHRISIDHTNITAAGLMKLARCKQLKAIGIGHTEIMTSEDFEKFKRVRPDCLIQNHTHAPDKKPI